MVNFCYVVELIKLYQNQLRNLFKQLVPITFDICSHYIYNASPEKNWPTKVKKKWKYSYQNYFDPVWSIGVFFDYFYHCNGVIFFKFFSTDEWHNPFSAKIYLSLIIRSPITTWNIFMSYHWSQSIDNQVLWAGSLPRVHKSMIMP